MRLPFLTCVILAACGADDPVGITVTIDAPADVDKVELFVAKAASVGLSGPPEVAPMAAKYFEVLNDRTGPSIIDPDRAFLLLNDTDDTQVVEMFVALGYDKAGNVVAAYQHHDTILVVPGKTELWRIELSPATDIQPGRLGPAEEFRARRWKRSDDTMPSCAILEHGGERYALGPTGDRDCDEHTIDTDEDECAPWIFLADATAPNAFANATCGNLVDLVPGNRPACLASGDSCSEVGPTQMACTRLTQDFCVPEGLCDCMTWDRACLLGKLDLQVHTSSYVKCHVCQPQTDYSDVPLQPLLAGSSSTCTNVRIHEVGVVPSLGTTATFPSGELEITDRTGCSVDLRWTGNGVLGTARDIGYVSLDLDNSKHMIVPLYIEYMCDGGQPSCTAHPRGPDPVRLCAEPPPDTTCGPDALCGLSPSCGSTCCKVGEYCENGVCRCGGNAGCADNQMCGGNTTVGCGSTCL